MFSLTVCDHIMIAHSFRGEEFGPAQKLHGATFAVEAEFRADKLDHLQLLVDIGLAKTELRRVLDTLDYSNLDDNPAFSGINTTTEFVTKHVLDRLAEAARADELGRNGRELYAIRVTVLESPSASASYEAPLW